MKTKQNKAKKRKNIDFKSNINVKAMTSGEHQKCCALNLLVSIKRLMLACLPCKRISVSWASFKSKSKVP